MRVQIKVQAGAPPAPSGLLPNGAALQAGVMSILMRQEAKQQMKANPPKERIPFFGHKRIHHKSCADMADPLIPIETVLIRPLETGHFQQRTKLLRSCRIRAAAYIALGRQIRVLDCCAEVHSRCLPEA